MKGTGWLRPAFRKRIVCKNQIMSAHLRTALQRHLPWVATWLAVTSLVVMVMVRQELNHQRDLFDANLHSVAQLLEKSPPKTDALLLALVQANSAQAKHKLENHLGQSHPQVVGISRREGDARIRASLREGRCP